MQKHYDVRSRRPKSAPAYFSPFYELHNFWTAAYILQSHAKLFEQLTNYTCPVATNAFKLLGSDMKFSLNSLRLLKYQKHRSSKCRWEHSVLTTDNKIKFNVKSSRQHWDRQHESISPSVAHTFVTITPISNVALRIVLSRLAVFRTFYWDFLTQHNPALKSINN